MRAILRALIPELIAAVSLAMFAAAVLTWAAIIGGLPQ
jgi:hypothetical protein